MKIKILITSLAFAVLALSGCKDFVEGINEDPNNPADAPIEAVLNAVNTGLILGHEGHAARVASMWSRQFTGSDRQYSGYEVYNTNSGDFDWDLHYIVVQNADIVIEKASKTNNLLASGIAKVEKAHTLGMVASMWGDIPFSEANRFPEIEDPKFDDQMSVYQGVQAILDDAISDLSGGPTNGVIAGVDIYFGGDAAKWEAVAWSLKARFYLHVGNYQATADAAAKGVLDPAGNWMIPHTQGIYLQDQNIYYGFGKVDREGYMTANEAILPAWLDPASANYRGNTKTDETPRFNHLYTGTTGTYDLNYAGMWAPSAAFPLVTATEVHLILAESEWRLGNMEAALTHLNHVRAILADRYPDGTYEAYEMSDFADGGVADIAGKTTEEALLYEILEEKYVVLVGQMEVFNDVRRTDNLLGLPPTQGNSIPERLLIPQIEIDANSNAPSPIPDLFAPTPANK